LIGMTGSALLAIGCLVEVVNPSLTARGDIVDGPRFRVFLLLLALSAPGLLFTQIGFFRSDAGGSGWLSRLALLIGAAGCLAIGLPALVGVFTLRDYAIQLIGQLATMMLAPILFGVAALGARRVAMWKRVWPLLTGLWPPMMFGFAVPAGFPAFAVPGVAGLLWLVWASSLPGRSAPRQAR
jgi:hypothetical protein